MQLSDNRKMSGILYIVATPIGNLGDITLRALETLRKVDLIICEDTRVSSKLLNHHEIKKPLISFHEHSEDMKINRVITQIKEGKEIALISDAGTPLISDPGYKLVRKVIEEGLALDFIPGPSAAIGALVLSGLPTDNFYFHGFLPPKKGRRENDLTTLKLMFQLHPTTLIFFESPYRIIHTLESIKAVFGAEAQVSVSKEITKMHEQTWRGTVLEVLEKLNKSTIKGEFTVALRLSAEQN